MAINPQVPLRRPIQFLSKARDNLDPAVVDRQRRVMRVAAWSARRFRYGVAYPILGEPGKASRRLARTALLGCMLAVWCASSAVAGENLIRNGGFETPGSPPAGFAMWGDAKYKDPANYTTVTDNPHDGKYCLRIHHPPNTGGYIITDPFTNAVRPKKGMTYAFSFWARSDTDTPSAFSVHSYRSVTPMIDGGTLGGGAIAAGKDWKQFAFSFTEGLDFFASDCGYVYLAFRTGKESETKTLYVDDIVVTEAPAQGGQELVDDNMLAYDPLPLRLSEGTETRITVDAAATVRPANRCVSGISFHRPAGYTGYPFSGKGNYTVPADVEEAIKALQLPMSRFYGVGDGPFPLNESIDKAAEALDRTGIPQGTTALEFEDQSANRLLTPEQWASGVKYSVSKGYKFRHWEIGNETYARNWGRCDMGLAFPDPETYIRHFIEVEAAIRAVQPEALIGISVDMRQTGSGNYVLKKAAGHYDFVVPHWYDTGAGLDFEETVLGSNEAALSRILQVNALLARYKKGRDAFQYDTEWGLAGSPNGISDEADPINANVFGVAYRAVRMLYYAREDPVRGASAWEMFRKDSQYGFCTFMMDQGRESKRSMIYWLYYYFDRHVGDRVLEISGTTPFYTLKNTAVPNRSGPVSVPQTPAMATASADGKTVYFMIVNGSWQDEAPVTVELKNFAVGTAEGVVLKSDDIKALPILDRKQDFVNPLPVKTSPAGVEFVLPGHSIVFVTLKQ